MTININGIDLSKISAYETEGIHVILGEGDEMLSGYYIAYPDVHSQGSNFAWLKRNLEKQFLKQFGITRNQKELIDEVSTSSL